MTAVKLPGQLEVQLVVDHKRCTVLKECSVRYSNSTEPKDNGRALAKLLRSYDESPTSQKWIDIQALAREILK